MLLLSNNSPKNKDILDLNTLKLKRSLSHNTN